MKLAFIFLISMILLGSFVSGTQLKLSILSQDPDPVLAGEVVEVRFKVENLRDITKEDIQLEIVPEFPFSVYESSNIKDLGKIPGRQTDDDAVVVDYKLKVDPDSVDGDNELNVRMHVGDAIISYDDTFFIDVEREKIALRPYLVASDFITGGSKGKITIEIANTGGSNVEALGMELLPSEDYKLLSTSNYVYLGDLDADDTETEDFTIYVEEGLTQVDIPIRLMYEVQDKDYSDETVLVLNLLTEEEAKKVGLIEESYTLAIVLAIIVIVVGFFVIRALRKR